MDDLIDRQKAINVIERMRAYIGHNMERAVGAAFIEILDDVGEDIGRLPSAQLATDTNVGTKLSTNLAEVGTDAVSRKAVKELAYSQIRSMYCGVALKEQRETMLRIADNVIGLLAPVTSAQPDIVRCKDCKHHWTHKCMDSIPIERCDLEQTFYDAEVDYCSLAERRKNG